MMHMRLSLNCMALPAPTSSALLRPRGSMPMLPQMRRGRRGMHWPTAGQCPLVPELLPTLPAVQGALELVAADVSADVRFFAANLLLSKVRQGWGRLAPDARAHLAAAIRCHPDQRAPSGRHNAGPPGVRGARRLCATLPWTYPYPAAAQPDAGARQRAPGGGGGRVARSRAGRAAAGPGAGRGRGGRRPRGRRRRRVARPAAGAGHRRR